LPVVQEPALRCFGEFALRKFGSHPEHCQGGERVGCILFSSEHRQVHFGYMRVSHFVEQQNECVCRHEFHPVDSLLLGEVLETGIVLEHACPRFDPGLHRRQI
jgi:hypothetical protein